MKKLNFEEDLKILIDDLAKERGLVSLSQPLVYEEEDVISEDQFDELRKKILGTVMDWLPSIGKIFDCFADVAEEDNKRDIIDYHQAVATAVRKLMLESLSLKEGVDYYEEEK